MIKDAKWIAPGEDMGEICPEFVKTFRAENVLKATLYITCMGVYEARLNGKRISNYVLAPGWTSYRTRLQYQSYDVTDLLGDENELCVVVAKGWYRGPWETIEKGQPAGLIAELVTEYSDGRTESLQTDLSWRVRESNVRYCDIYNGESVDARVENMPLQAVKFIEKSTESLIPQEGEIICEREYIRPRRIFTTPAGERVVDFGQEVTGYVEFTVEAHEGDLVSISHAEVLDQKGNFYTENYRCAKAKLDYICKEGRQSFKPGLTFYGFRYIRLDSFPGEPTLDDLRAVLVCSDIKRTGYVRCGNAMINRLYENVTWGQRDNFLDIPTDCPQRDERLGWTGDAQVFIKTACYNYDVLRFFKKWLADLQADQLESGLVPNFIPSMDVGGTSAAWGDVALIAPWQLYMSYGAKEVLERQLGSMKGYLKYIQSTTKTEYLWIGHGHFGDWVGLDAPAGSYKGSSREDFIASAFYANCADILAKTSRVLGLDDSEYVRLHEKIVEKFRQTYTQYLTQTECILALVFDLTEDRAATAALLAKKVRDCGTALQTGFVGTPYILSALSRNGYAELAYDLLLKEDYPSWLYPITKGATTVWEHWDGIMPSGEFWSPDMNSFNHYAYGSVIGWVYEQAAGIRPTEDAPGYERAAVEPHPDRRLGWLEASLDTPHGRIFSGWYYELEGLRYEIRTPVPTVAVIEGRRYELDPGEYIFFGE